MSSTLNMLSTYTDQDVDPGPVHTSTHARGAALTHLAAAITSGELHAVPDRLRRALALKDTITAHRSTLGTAGAVDGIPNMVHGLVRDVLNGTAEAPDVTTLADMALVANMEAERRQVTSVALDALANVIPQHLASVVTETEDEMLAVLREDLAPVITQLQEAAEALAGLDHSDPATVAGATDAQRHALTVLPDLARRYNRLRMMQRDVYAAGQGEPVGKTPHSPSSYGWRHTFASGVHEFQHITPGDPGPATDLPGHLRILAVAQRPDVWLPTREQMESALTLSTAPKRTQAIEEDRGDTSQMKVTNKRSAATNVATW